MESLFLLLGLLGVVVSIGGIVGFFSLFTSNSRDAKIREIERETQKLNLEITNLSSRLELLKKSIDTQPQTPPLQAAAMQDVEPKLVVTPALEPKISDTDLAEQALAAAKPSVEATSAIKNAQNS